MSKIVFGINRIFNLSFCSVNIRCFLSLMIKVYNFIYLLFVRILYLGSIYIVLLKIRGKFEMSVNIFVFNLLYCVIVKYFVFLFG